MVRVMSKVIVKVSYHNPRSKSKNISGYAEYIATREGVELRNQDPNRPPDTTYADYVATRPGVEKRGNHGLFSIEDKPINLKSVSNELKNHAGNVWTVIVSLKREDAQAKGYDNSEAWRELITDKAEDIAKNFNLPITELCCYAAFHNEGEHPHIHMLVYSKHPEIYGGYHKASSLQNLKSVFTNEIFSEELSEIYKLKTGYRDELRKAGADAIRSLAEHIRENKNASSDAIRKFKDLALRLKSVDGRKVYGYLPSDVKDMVDDLLKEIASDPRFVELYEKWYEQKALQQEFYNSKEIERLPIEQNDEFKSIRNAIVKEAAKLKVESDVASQIAVDDIIDLLCSVYVHQADEMDLQNSGCGNAVVESQKDVDEALGIKHQTRLNV